MLKRNNNGASGFTLLEMMFSIVVVGLLVGMAASAYSSHIKGQQISSTAVAMEKVNTALQMFKDVNGRYPCPAPLLEPRDSAKYGHEVQCDLDPGAPDIPPDPALDVDPGHCINPASFAGVCIEHSPRDTTGEEHRVRVGALPFRQLLLDEKDTFDGYGNRLVYAVTEKLANEATYVEKGGGVKIIDATGAALSEEERSAAYVVISPGKNKNGAVSMNGKAASCVGTNLDTQNCRDFTTTTNTDAVYAMDLTSTGFDDAVNYFIPNTVATWRRTANTSENVTDMSEGRVAVGIDEFSDITDALNVGQSTVNYSTSPSQYSVLAPVNGDPNHQTGSLRVGKNGAGNSKIFAKEYCDRKGQNCFKVQDFVAMPTCGTNEYMTGIRNGNPICKPIRFYCDDPKVLTGFDSSNKPVCTLPQASCPEVPNGTEICGVVGNLPALGSGVEYRVSYNANGACAEKWYKCNVGAWSQVSTPPGSKYDPVNYSPARCSYNSGSPTSGTDKGLSCGSGYSGSYDQNWYLDCKGTKVYTTKSNNTCSCQGLTSSENYYCPQSFGGQLVATRSLTKGCSGGNLDSNWTPGGWVDLNGTPISDPFALCNCTKTGAWQFANCTVGKIRKDTPTPEAFDDPLASWPGDKRLGGYAKVKVDKTTCSLITDPYNYSNCICNMSEKQFVDRDPTCTSCQEVLTKSKIRQMHDIETCGWIDDPDTSANTQGQCKEKRFVWLSDNNVVATAPLDQSNGGAVEPNSACSCSQSGKAETCAVQTASQWLFYTCTCTYRP